MAAGSGKENIQRSDTNCWERKAVNAEDHITIYDVEETAYRRNKEEYAHTQREREREREREAQRISLFIRCNTYKITTNLYKRLQGHFI